jgi:phage terminase small subunit
MGAGRRGTAQAVIGEAPRRRNGGGTAMAAGAVVQGRGGQFAPSGGAPLTELQQAFVLEYVRNGGVANAAAVAAGYTEQGARGAAYQLVRNPKVINAIRLEQRRFILTELASASVYATLDQLRDPVTPAHVRHQAAKLAAQMSGLLKTEENQGFDFDKPMVEMSIEELEAFVAAGAAAVKDIKNQRVKVIEGTLADSPADRGSAQGAAQPDDDDLLS